MSSVWAKSRGERKIKARKPQRSPGFFWSEVTSDCERRTAAARCRGVGVLEDKSAAHHLIFEIDLRALEIEVALGVADHADTMSFKLLVVVVALLGQVEDIR